MNNKKQLPRLIIFSSVATHGSFTKAAEYLGMSKSAVSQQISLLEKELNTRLLNRTTRGLSLTSIGEKVLKRSLILQDQVDLLFNDIEEAGETPKGKFSITYPHSLQSTVVLPAVKQLCIEFPGLEPELIADDHTKDLISNNIDVAIHIGELPDSSYRALPVGNLTEIFCATPLYLNKHPAISTAEDLCKHRWIANSWQSATMKINNVNNNQSENITLTRFAKTNTLLTTVEMTLQHMGIALVPNILAKRLINSGEFIHIVKHVTGPQWPIYTLHAYQHEKPIYLTRFHQLICRFIENK